MQAELFVQGLVITSFHKIVKRIVPEKTGFYENHIRPIGFRTVL